MLTYTRARSFVTAALLLVGAAYLYLGFSRLVADFPGSFPIDLQLRWIEHRFLADGLNPQEQGHPGLPDSHAQMREQGGGYPPWAYAIGTLLVPPFSFTTARWYYAGVCALAIVALAAWGYRHSGFLGVAAVVALFPVAICVSYGQYGVVLAGLVVGALWLLNAGRPIAAGLCLGLSLVKPQLCGLFILTALLHGHYRAVAAASLTLVAASIAAAAAAQTSVVKMLANFGGETALYFWLSHNPLLPWTASVAGFGPAVAILAVAGIAATALCWRLQGAHKSLTIGFAVAAVVTMFWSYRRHYDTALMAVALIPLIAVAEQSGWRTRILALLVGATLWLPVRHAQWDWVSVKVADLVLWTTAAAVLLIWNRRHPWANLQRLPE